MARKEKKDALQTSTGYYNPNEGLRFVDIAVNTNPITALSAGIYKAGATNAWGGSHYTYNGKEYKLAKNNMSSLTGKNMRAALDKIIPYITSGGSLQIDSLKQDTKMYNELKTTLGGDHFENKLQYLAYMIEDQQMAVDKNGNVYNSAGQIIDTETGKPLSLNSSSDDGSGLSKYEDLIKNNLMTDAASRQAQQYRDAMYGSIAQYENTANSTLAKAEMDAYRALGQSQLQLENQIAAERMNAIKSGVTSAQLASREIASMFATQTGAAQVASQMAQNRADMANQFGQQRAAVEGDLWNILNGNQQTAANTYAQLGTAQASYNSYINSYAAQLQAMMNAWRSDPYAYSQSSTTRSKAED